MTWVFAITCVLIGIFLGISLAGFVMNDPSPLPEIIQFSEPPPIILRGPNRDLVNQTFYIETSEAYVMSRVAESQGLWLQVGEARGGLEATFREKQDEGLVL